MNDDSLISLGDDIKSLGVSEDGTKARIGGYLVRFGSSDDRDAAGDWFTPQTDFGPNTGTGAPTLIHHGLPLTPDPRIAWTRSKKLAPLSVTQDEIGLFAETVCNLADRYEAKVYELVKMGKLKWSSGADIPFMRRRDGQKSGEITHWPIIEGSLTPTPCQYDGTTAVTSIKSFLESEEVEAEVENELKIEEGEADDDGIKKYNPRQPRDDAGRWSEGGASGGFTASHAVAVMRAEGIDDPKKHEEVTRAISAGIHRTPEHVLRHIDRIHWEKGRGVRMDGANAVPQQTLAQARDKAYAAVNQARGIRQKIFERRNAALNPAPRATKSEDDLATLDEIDTLLGEWVDTTEAAFAAPDAAPEPVPGEEMASGALLTWARREAARNGVFI